MIKVLEETNNVSEKKEISAHFNEALFGGTGGGNRETCELCGRIHFATWGDFEEGELEELEKRAELQPDKYVKRGEDESIWHGSIFGKEAVLDCPCNKLADIEQLIWDSRFVIANYLKNRSKAQLQKAQQQHSKIGSIELVK